MRKHVIIISSIFLGIAIACGAFFSYSISSLFSKENSNMAYYNALMCSVYGITENTIESKDKHSTNNLEKQIQEELSECWILTVRLRHVIIHQLKEIDYTKKTTKEQEKHIDGIIESFLQNHLGDIFENNEKDVINLAKSWIVNGNLSDIEDSKIGETYLEHDKSTELLKLISDYLSVTKA